MYAILTVFLRRLDIFDEKENEEKQAKKMIN